MHGGQPFAAVRRLDDVVAMMAQQCRCQERSIGNEVVNNEDGRDGRPPWTFPRAGGRKATSSRRRRGRRDRDVTAALTPNSQDGFCPSQTENYLRPRHLNTFRSPCILGNRLFVVSDCTQPRELSKRRFRRNSPDSGWLRPDGVVQEQTTGNTAIRAEPARAGLFRWMAVRRLDRDRRRRTAVGTQGPASART